MRYLGITKREAQENLLKVVACSTALVVGAGVALCLTLFYLSLGSRLILWGTGAGAAGWFLAIIIPAFGKYEEIQCPACLTRHQVSYHAGQFHCEYCEQKIFGPGFWRAGRNKAASHWRKAVVPAAPRPASEDKSLRCKEAR